MVTNVNKRPDADLWWASMHEEMCTLENRGTWHYKILPSNVHIVNSHFVFKTKHKADRTIECYKSRLVARGFSQIDGIDYFSDDTFAPTPCLATMHVVMAMAAKGNWLM